MRLNLVESSELHPPPFSSDFRVQIFVLGVLFSNFGLPSPLLDRTSPHFGSCESQLLHLWSAWTTTTTTTFKVIGPYNLAPRNCLWTVGWIENWLKIHCWESGRLQGIREYQYSWFQEFNTLSSPDSGIQHLLSTPDRNWGASNSYIRKWGASSRNLVFPMLHTPVAQIHTRAT